MQISFDAVVLTQDEEAFKYFDFNHTPCLWFGDFWKSVNLAIDYNFEYIVTLDKYVNLEDTYKMLVLMNDYDLVIGNNWEVTKYLSNFRVYRTSLLQNLKQFDYKKDGLLHLELATKAISTGAKIGFYKTEKQTFDVKFADLKDIFINSTKQLFAERPNTLESSLY